MENTLPDLNFDKFPLAVAYLDATDVFVLDVITKQVYELVQQYEIVDPNYPKGGFRVDKVWDDSVNVDFESEQTINYQCFYYVPTGEIWGIFKNEEPIIGHGILIPAVNVA